MHTMIAIQTKKDKSQSRIDVLIGSELGVETGAQPPRRTSLPSGSVVGMPRPFVVMMVPSLSKPGRDLRDQAVDIK